MRSAAVVLGLAAMPAAFAALSVGRVTTDGERVLWLLALTVSSPVSLALAWRQPAGARGVARGGLGAGAVVAGALLAARLAAGAALFEAFAAPFLGFAALVSGLVVLEQATARGKLAGLCPLLLGVLFAVGPLTLDGWLVAGPAPDRVQTVLETATSLSPAIVAAEASGVGFFKQEGVYRRWLAGEQLFVPPSPREATALLGASAAGVLLASLVIAVLRRACTRGADLLESRPEAS